MSTIPSQNFFVIVDESRGLYIVYKESMVVCLIELQDIYDVAAVMKLDVEGEPAVDVLYRVAGNLDLRNPGMVKNVEAYRKLDTGFPLCLALEGSFKVVVGRGNR